MAVEDEDTGGAVGGQNEGSQQHTKAHAFCTLRSDIVTGAYSYSSHTPPHTPKSRRVRSGTHRLLQGRCVARDASHDAMAVRLGYGFAFGFGDGRKLKPYALVARIRLMMIVLIGPDLFGDALGEGFARFVVGGAIQVCAGGALGLNFVCHKTHLVAKQIDESALFCKELR